VKKAVLMHVGKSTGALVDDGPDFIFRYRLGLVFEGSLKLIYVFVNEFENEAKLVLESDN
jgi:hypothetical protein